MELLERLKAAGVQFAQGLTEEEVGQAEKTFGITFPCEIREFYMRALPVGDSFFDWRDLSQENVERFSSFYQWMEKKFLFDIANNALAEELGPPYDQIDDPMELERRIMEDVRHSTKLVPFFAHRCFFNGMDGMPIVSFWQPVDTIFYGDSFLEYLEVEFLDKELPGGDPPERMKDTGIWSRIVVR